MSRRDDRTKVEIFTDHYRITGEITLMTGARLTDFTVDAKTFFAVADARVTDHTGREITTAQFLNVHRDHVEFIIPG